MMKSDYVGPFLAGVGLGAAAAILLAPASGERTRQRIADMANRTSDALKEQADYLSNAAGDVLDKGRQMLRKGEDTGRQAAGNFENKAKIAVHAAGKSMEQHGQHLQNV